MFLAEERRGSLTWNAIGKAMTVLEDGWQMKIGEGNRSFWYSP